MQVHTVDSVIQVHTHSLWALWTLLCRFAMDSVIQVCCGLCCAGSLWTLLCRFTLAVGMTRDHSGTCCTLLLLLFMCYCCYIVIIVLLLLFVLLCCREHSRVSVLHSTQLSRSHWFNGFLHLQGVCLFQATSLSLVVLLCCREHYGQLL